MISRSSKQGAVLVAGMLVLAILSLLGAASLLTASIDARMVSNQRGSKQAFYAAEAALNIGIDELLQFFRDKSNHSAFAPDGSTPTPAEPIDGTDFNGFAISYRIELLPDQDAAGETTAVPQDLPTPENAQSIQNTVYDYKITGIADHTTLNDHEEISEVVRILERPLSRYLAFYEDDMSWRPRGAALTINGGRLHTNGDMYFGPANNMTMLLTNSSPVGINAGGMIYHGEALDEGGGTTAGASIFIDKDQSAGITAPLPLLQDHAATGAPIGPTNHAATEQDYLPSGPALKVFDSLVHAGVDRIVPDTTRADLQIGDRYQELCDGTLGAALPYDTLYISGNGLALSIYAKLAGNILGAPVTGLIQNIETSGGVTALVNSWGSARTNSNGLTAFTATPPVGTIVYEGVLEDPDPRDGANYALTVIDVQRLEYWYKDWMLVANGIDIDITPRRLLIYISRTGTGQAIKLVGSSGGRVLAAGARQTALTTWVPTTIVTPLPLYIQGDFNRANLGGGVDGISGSKTVIMADAVTVLSNDWTVAPSAGGVAAQTAVNASFFTGRPDYSAGTGAAEGVENLLRLAENWTGQTLTTRGTFSSLWFSGISNSQFNEAAFSPPNYVLEWDIRFKTSSDISTTQPSPPESPKTYFVNRQAWQEQ